MLKASLLLAASASAQMAPPQRASVAITVDPLGAVPTLAAAQGALRAALAAHGGAVDVEVSLAPGTHRVPRGGLALTAADSPAPGHRVTWRGAGRLRTSLSGGANVTGWLPLNDPSLPAAVVAAPAPAELLDTSRQLYVDGVRARRTQRAAGAALPGLALEQRADCVACSYSVDPSSGALAWANAGDVEFVWQGVASGWSESRCAVLSVAPGPGSEPNCTVDPSNEADCGFTDSTEAQCVANKTAAHPLGCCWHEGGLAPSTRWCVAPAFPGAVSSTRVSLKQPCMWNLVNRPFQPYGGEYSPHHHPPYVFFAPYPMRRQPQPHTPCSLLRAGSPPSVVENVRSHIDTPGQWYHDRAAGLILYYPLPGQDMASVSVIVPVEESLLSLRGAARHSFANMTLEHATWLRPSQDEGIVDQQSAAANICRYGIMPPDYGCGANDTYITTPGNVALVAAADVDFFGVAFQHLGAYAASARGGSQGISFRWCVFRDTSAGAVMLGDALSYDETDSALWDSDMLVADCEMQGAVELSGATTVFVAYVQNATVEHCLLFNASYSSFTVGWGWGREASRRGGNSIVANRILGSQVGRCCDGGGIYTLGPQPGSVITGNYIAQGSAAWGPHAGNGIYHDNGSAGFTDTENVIDGDFDRYFFQDSMYL